MELKQEIRKFASITVCFGVLFFCVSGACQLSAAQMAAVITTMNGEVLVIAYQKSAERAAKVGDFIYEGDTVKTSKGGQAAITFTNGAVVKLNQSAEFTIDVTGSVEDIGTKIKMKAGKLWSKVRPKSKFEVNTPIALVAVRGTEFETELFVGRLNLSVFDGIVNVKNKYGEVDVSRGKKTTVAGGNAPEPPSDLKDNDKPVWQDELQTKNVIKVEIGQQTIEQGGVAEIAITALDANGKIDGKYEEQIEVKSDNSAAEFSADGTRWDNQLKLNAVKGRATVKLRCGVAGDVTVSAASIRAEPGIAKITVKKNTKTLKLNIDSKTGAKNITIKFKKK